MSFTTIVGIPCCATIAALAGFASFECGRLSLFHFHNYSNAKKNIMQTSDKAQSLIKRVAFYPGIALRRHEATQAFTDGVNMALKSLALGAVALSTIAALSYILSTRKSSID